jgi:hypothetical protein
MYHAVEVLSFFEIIEVYEVIMSYEAEEGRDLADNAT